MLAYYFNLQARNHKQICQFKSNNLCKWDRVFYEDIHVTPYYTTPGAYFSHRSVFSVLIEEYIQWFSVWEAEGGFWYQQGSAGLKTIMDNNGKTQD